MPYVHNDRDAVLVFFFKPRMEALIAEYLLVKNDIADGKSSFFSSFSGGV